MAIWLIHPEEHANAPLRRPHADGVAMSASAAAALVEHVAVRRAETVDPTRVKTSL
jgi:hypothetical protein